MSTSESVVAVIKQPEAPAVAVPDEKEGVIKKEISVIEAKAGEVVIVDEESYQSAVEFGRMIQTKAAEVKDFFKPMKDAANKAHKEICAREKAMLEPLDSAKKILQKTVGDYQFEQERIRREAEEAAKKAAQEEAERNLQKAVDAEANGDADAASAALEEAEFAETMAASTVVESSAPVAKGATVKVDYEITSCNEELVPVKVGDTVIRPVDEKAVLKAIRESGGKIQISGVTYKEVPKTSFRRF